MAFDHSKYNLERYHRIRAEKLAALGGVCVDCGFTEDLEFDHVDPENKSFSIGDIMTYPSSVVDAELDKCVLRCKSCHITRTAEQQSVEHGEGASGKKNCKCRPCKNRKNEYMREWKRKRALLFS